MNVAFQQPVLLDGFATVPSLFWNRVTAHPDKVVMQNAP
jgi:hypothetical protein